MYYHEKNVEKINEGHMQIFQLVEAGKFDAASDAMRDHIQYDMVYALNAYKEYQENHKS